MTSEFVGRHEALAVLRDELRAAAAGSSRVVWVEGEAGIGKSSLLRRFLDEESHDRVVMWAGGAEEERLLPFGVVEQLAAVPGRLTIGSSDPLTVGAQLLGALGEVDGVGVLVVDDLQWADAESASALLFALRRMHREQVLAILATRPDPASALGDSWGRLLRDERRVRRVGLDGLRVDELVDLSTVTVGSPLGPSGAERLHEHTHGHPMHARALLEELGTVELDTVHGVLPAPRSLATIILAKVAALPAPAQDLLTALAVLGTSSPLPLAAVVGQVTEPSVALEAAMDAELVARSHGGEVGFAHPLMRGAIYNDISPTRRRDLHLAAAAMSSGLVALDHRVAAAEGPDEALAGELEALGLHELGEERAALAERHFQAASALFPHPADRDRCALLAVEAVAAGGDLSQVRARRPVVEACADTPQRSYLLGGVEFASGRLSRAEELFASALADLPGDTPTTVGLRSRAAASLAIVRVLLGRWEAAIDPGRIALELGGDSNGLARYAMAVCLSQFGRVDEVKRVLGERDGDDPHRALLSGLVRLWSDDLSGGVTELTAAVRPDRAGRSPRLLVVALCALSDAHYRLGRWDDAVVDGELAVSLAHDRDQIVTLQQAHPVASYVHAGRGSFAVAEEHIAAAALLVELVPSWTGSVFVSLARAVLAQARDDAPAMRQAVGDLLDGTLRANLEGVANWPWRVLVADACLGVGELDEAQRAVEGLDQLMARWGLRSPITDAARLRGTLAVAAGDLQAARSAFETGLAGPLNLPMPAARLRMAYGRLLREQGAKRAAIEQLRLAREGLAGLGASPYVARCDDELAACGVAAKRGSADPLGLTPTELTVAHLVAQGLSNREVAARLYVSAKAVEYHLGHIYAKLGITSRRRLAARLTERSEN